MWEINATVLVFGSRTFRGAVAAREAGAPLFRDPWISLRRIAVFHSGREGHLCPRGRHTCHPFGAFPPKSAFRGGAGGPSFHRSCAPQAVPPRSLPSPSLKGASGGWRPGQGLPSRLPRPPAPLPAKPWGSAAVGSLLSCLWSGPAPPRLLCLPNLLFSVTV